MKNSNVEKHLYSAIFGAIMLIAAFPITPNKLKNVGFIVLLALSLVKYFTNKKRNIYTKKFLINASLYFVYLFSLLYTDSIDIAGLKLDTAVTIVIFPFIFFVLQPLHNKEGKMIVHKFTLLYYFFTLLYTAVVFGNAYNIDTTLFFSSPWVIRKTIDKMYLIGQHPIYASMIISLGILFSFQFFSRKASIVIKIAVTFLNLFLVIILVLLASKGVIMALIIASITYLFFNIAKRRIKIISIALILIGFVLSLIYIPPLTSRFKDLKELEKLEIKPNKYSSTSIRKGIYYCSTEKIKDNWLFGYGIGDVQLALNDCYKTIDDGIFNKFDYNSHNQYLGVLLTTGVFGLFALLLMLASNLHLAITNKDWVFLSILVLFIVSFLTENILERQSGVVLFSFLLSFFGSRYSDNLK